MSFWDNVKKFAQPYADEDYEEYDDEELDEYEEEQEEEAPRARRRNNPFATAPTSAPQYAAPAASTATATATATPAAPAAPVSGSFSGQVLNMSGKKQEVVLFHAKAFEDAAKAADELRNRRAVILNMEKVESTLTRRVVDFLSGCIYALEGDVKKIAQSTYLFCPHSMDIVGDLEDFQPETDSYI